MLKGLCGIFTLLFIFGFSPILLGNESGNKYFPGALDSFWVYEDQDGNELTRRAIEGEEIAGKIFPAFSYEPELEDWIEYSPFIHSSLCNVNDAEITLVVGGKIENAVKARLKKEIETFVQIAKSEEGSSDYDLDIEIKVDAQDYLLFLPDVIAVNEEWDANQIEAEVKLINIDNGVPDDEQFIIDFTIIETGIILGAETVKTPAGTFEDCLKVKYQTESTAEINPHEETDPPGETVTTVWFAPNVGIVKFHQIRKYTFLELIPEDEDFPMPPDPKPITFELKNYEIKSSDTKSSKENSSPAVESAGDKVETKKVKPISNEARRSKYFPSTLDSFWVYEDQDGNKLTRHAIEGEEIAGKTYSAFRYEPEFEDDWINYTPFVYPSLYHVSDTGIKLVVGDEVEKAFKARLSKELDIFTDAMKNQDSSDENYTYNIKVEAEDLLHLLLTSVSLKEEWDVNQVEINFDAVAEGKVMGGVDYSIKETGIVQGTETIETASGTFEDCLKVEYRTETTATFDPPEVETGLPGETVTTVWFAPNVGIVKLHQKSGHMFLDMIPENAGLPIVIPPSKETTWELKEYKIKTTDLKTDGNDHDLVAKQIENESENEYFSSTLGSFWVYTDQDGNELTRRAVEGEEIAGKTYSAFRYEPDLEDWTNYTPFVYPSLYRVSDAGIKLVISGEVEKAVKARLSKEMEAFIGIIKQDDPTASDEFTYNINIEAEDHFNLLPMPITLKEEWGTNQIKVSLEIAFAENDQLTIDFTILETGIVQGKETVKTAAGTFEGCLKVEYRTETTAVFTPPVPPDEVDPPGETVTTVWFAPNVGIVQFHQKMDYTFLELIPEEEDLPLSPAPKEKTLKLKKYEIKTAESESNDSD